MAANHVRRHERCGGAWSFPAILLRILLVVFCLPAGPAHAADSDLVEVYAEEQQDGSYIFFVNNNHIIPVYVWIDTPQLINMAADCDLPIGLGLAAGARAVRAFSLAPVRSSGRRGYSLQYTWAQGDPETAHHDDSYRYTVPFAHGDKHRLSQGFHGRFSHYDDNEYAVDFDMDIGTEVFAARGGMVAEVKEDSRVGGPSASYGDDANYVLVLHDDGSFGNYAHLMYDGAAVEAGDIVVPGQLLGYSGNTGRSSGPHLHFDVRLPGFDGTMRSVPFLFRGRDRQSLEPVEGDFYYSYHPDGPEFEEEFGNDITLADYSDYAEPATGPETVDTRVEQIDLTFLVFVSNGFPDDLDVELRFHLAGLDSDAGETVRVTVPARTEILATILRPAPGASTIRYSYTVSYVR